MVQYIYLVSKLLAPVVCFAELVLTGLLAVWAKQLDCTLDFKPARNESNVPKLKVLLSNLYTVKYGLARTYS